MEQAGIIFFNLLILFAYFGIGIYARRKNIITETGVGSFTKFTLNIALPCTIFQSFTIELTAENMKIAALLLIVSAGTCAISFLVGTILFHRFSRAQQCVMRYSVLISNCTFVGLPLMSGLCGPMGIFYTSVFVIPNRFFMWSAGVWMFSKKNAGWRENVGKVIWNPCMIACYLGAVWLFFHFPLPDFVKKVIGSVGACTAPVSMITIGAILAGVRLKDVFSKNAWVISFCRLLLMPALVWGILRFLSVDSMTIMISVLMTGMPLANTVILLAEEYEGDVRLASGATLLSVLLSMITIPLLAMAF